MNLLGSFDLRRADVYLASNALVDYCDKLTHAVQCASQRVSDAWVQSEGGGHSLVPGEWGLVRKPQKQPLGKKWEGPYQMLLITTAAVKVPGKKSWMHASHCKREKFVPHAEESPEVKCWATKSQISTSQKTNGCY